MLADASHMNTPKSWIENDFPGIYVKNVETGSYWDSFFVDINKQVEQFTTAVKSDPQLKNGFNAIGHSQGALIVRAYIERN